MHSTVYQRQTLKKLPNVTVTGKVDDVRPYLSSAISIAPLRLACGVQNKVLEALASGRPVVASPFAAEGLNLSAREELLIADSPDNWITAIELLLTDPVLADRLGKRGRLAVIDRYSWDQTGTRMLNCIHIIDGH